MGCLKLTNISNFHYSITSPLERLGEVALLDTERTTLHVMDDTKTVALVETLTFDNGNTPNTITVRYQYDNHLGSACLELDQHAEIISYEEYHPFGTTSYRSGRNETEISLKRYKYVGKERDEETGLYYYGARYYAAWLCRFVSVDPLQHEYPHYTPYQYAGNKPISYIDLDGLEEAKPKSNNYPPPQLSFPNYPQDQIAKQTPRFNASQQTPTKPSQQYSKLFNIDPKYLQNSTAVKPQNTTTTYHNKENYDQRQLDQKQAQFKKELQATDNFFYGESGQPIGSSGMLGSVKAGAEVHGLIEGGYGIIKLGQAIKKFALLKALGSASKVESAVSNPVATVTEIVVERPGLTGSIQIEKTTGVINAKLAGKVHPKTNIRFHETGFPDFSENLYKEGVNDIIIKPTGNRAADFTAANKVAGYNSTPKGFTWHHHQSTGRMQLVETTVHSQTAHTGGFSLWKY